MNSEWLSHIGRFFVLVILQGTVFRNIELLDGRMQVYVYILFVMLLPFRTLPMLTMFLAFVVGLAVDTFYNTMGVHASAAVVIGLLRERVLLLLSPRDGYDIKDRPTISSLGLTWFLQYALLMIIIHHTWFFFLETFSFKNFTTTLSKILFSSILTFSFLLLGQYLFYRHSGSKS